MVIFGKVSSEPIFIITQTIIKQFYQNKQLHRQCKLNVDFSWFVTMFLCVLIPYVCYIPHVCRCTFSLRNFNVLLNFKKSKGRQKEREKKLFFVLCSFLKNDSIMKILRVSFIGCPLLLGVFYWVPFYFADTFMRRIKWFTSRVLQVKSWCKSWLLFP